MTHPDLAFPTHKVAQFMQNPGKAHWHAVQRIIRYAYTTRNNVLTLGGASPKPGVSPLYAYCNADFANEKDHACSVSGYALFYGNQGAFAWSAKKQTATALSTGEAEYYSGTHGGREVLWIHQFLCEIGFKESAPTPLKIDSTSAIHTIETPDQVSNRTKHINVAYHWIHEAVKAKIMQPEYVPIEDNVADICTKSLMRPKYETFSQMLGMRPRQDASWGGVLRYMEITNTTTHL